MSESLRVGAKTIVVDVPERRHGERRRYVTTPATRGETMGRPCRKCHSGSRVLDSEDVGPFTRRRRECKTCGFRWTTRERDEE